ncbi:MAG: UxaA family hydrolase [Ardenticatenales bacterium]|nr:UxaA family hydrolase [Ardenticatenales bacterium]
MPFGTALRDIAPGEYVCNEEMLVELRQRQLEFPLPAAANFSDDIPPFVFDPDSFTPAEPLPRQAATATFQGYLRPGGRGVGTRNQVILLAANGTVAGFTKALAERLQGAAAPFANVDGVVAAVHTEGVRADGNNKDLLLRSLAGYITHPNAGAVLIIDNGVAGLRNEMIQRYLLDNGYPLDAVTHQFFSVNGPFAGKLAEAAAIVEAWLPELNQMARSAQPVSELKIALQCGGSDAFSGISGNPLIAWVAKALISQGGAANLAETDELQGAEAYILRRARDGATAARFLEVVERFKSWAERHGQSASANPSGGNRYRGLYNIYLKSLGAAAKRHPDVPLDYVIDYSEPMVAPGYYFMDSPGNDLESIAGQVGSGCNLIFFVTGNGSITNFPFVPTIKVVTTSERFTQLQSDMDVDAGRYLTGTPMDELGAETFAQMLAVASGEAERRRASRSRPAPDLARLAVGADETLATLGEQPAPSGQPLAITTTAAPALDFGAPPAQPVALILPTSLCSGQIARLAAERFNRAATDSPYSRFATLVHTEGCGVTTQTEFLDTLLGHMVHPLTGACLLLEHGCEKTHNHYWQGKMRDAGLALADYGWASIQGDGGIEKSMARVWDWFAAQSEGFADPSGSPTRQVGEPPSLGLLATAGRRRQRRSRWRIWWRRWSGRGQRHRA